MVPLSNDVSRLDIQRWDDGFVAQKLLGLFVAALLAATVLGGKALVLSLAG